MRRRPAPAHAGAQARVAAGMRSWDIELGGRNVVALRVARRDLVRERRPLTLVREALTYDLSPRGLQLSADLKLDVLGADPPDSSRS